MAAVSTLAVMGYRKRTGRHEPPLKLKPQSVTPHDWRHTG